MARTIRIKIYKFNELSESIQTKVLNEMRGFNVDFNWWNDTYNDAKQIGLQITGFDLEYRQNITGNFIWEPKLVAKSILKDHGLTCGTYQQAKAFFDEAITLKDGDSKINLLEERFLNNLLSEYFELLKEDYIYFTSDNAVKEMIETNEYEFFVNGEKYNKNKFGGKDK